MKKEYQDLFTLKAEKLTNASLIMYKALASFNYMAFSSKELVKEENNYFTALLINTLMINNRLNKEDLEIIFKTFDSVKPYKKLKLLKRSLDDTSLMEDLKKVNNDILYEKMPRFVMVGCYFDDATKNKRTEDEVKGTDIYINAATSLCGYIKDLDGDMLNPLDLEEELKPLLNLIEKESKKYN